MGRPKAPERKLLDQIIPYLAAHGIASTTIQPLAKHLGTSAYTVTYQFGTREQMLVDALTRLLDKREAAILDDPDTNAWAYRHWHYAHPGETRLLLEALALAPINPSLRGVGVRLARDYVTFNLSAADHASILGASLVTQGEGLAAGAWLD